MALLQVETDARASKMTARASLNRPSSSTPSLALALIKSSILQSARLRGVVLALESTKAIRSQIAEPLYVAYDDAASNRAGELKG